MRKRGNKPYTAHYVRYLENVPYNPTDHHARYSGHTPYNPADRAWVARSANPEQTAESVAAGLIVTGRTPRGKDPY
jgi:hypothetical protein